LVIQNIKLSEETQRAHNELTELSRMKADFVAVASHELRTPLGLVLGHTTQLLEHITDSEDRQQLEAVLRGAERLKKIIEDLEKVQLVPQEPTNLRRSKFALEQLVQEVVASFQDFADRKHIALQTQLPKMALTIEGDAEKIGIALSNLVKNAITFTNEGGRVLIAAERIPGYVKVSVIDNGIGIPAKDLHRVFERFFQVQSHMTRRHGGMGLGLSVAKVMIEMHGGQIWVESVESKGSNFSFLLPISTVQADAARKVFQT
jgi:signal transduction histidine kinase